MLARVRVFGSECSPTPAHNGATPMRMQHRGRELDALELIAGELERLRILKEHELGVRLEHPPSGDPPYADRVEE